MIRAAFALGFCLLGALPAAAEQAPKAVAPAPPAMTAPQDLSAPTETGAETQPDSGAGGFAPDTASLIRNIVPHKEATVETEAMADLAAMPSLILLPMAVPTGTRADSGMLAKAESGLRLGLVQSGRFRVWSREEAVRAWPRGAGPPEGCFAARCVGDAAQHAPSALILASQFTSRDSQWVLKLVLAQAPGGKIRRAMQLWAKSVVTPAADSGAIAFAQEAGQRMANPDRSGHGIDGSFFATGEWHRIPWLNPRDSVDNRKSWAWSGSALLAAGLGLAYAGGQLTAADENRISPARDMLSGSGAQSFLRGFFAAPTLGARYAAMGGAGIAAVDDGLAVLMNPAGVAASDRQNVTAAKRSLPDGTPSFFVAYAGPGYHRWYQGVGVRFEGDALASEATLHGTVACDLEMLGPQWAGIKAGAQGKIYLAQVGSAGTGADRSTGHSFGTGLDLGLQAPLNDRITAALSVRDLAGFLRHSNTFTNDSYSEALPTEWNVGAAYRAGRSLTLLIDGQKAMWADQADHLRLGGEEVLWEFLALRGGLHEIFGREAVRKIAVGFGLDTDGLKDKSLRVHLSLDYAYEFGLNEDAPLAGGQQFSLSAGF